MPDDAFRELCRRHRVLEEDVNRLRSFIDELVYHAKVLRADLLGSSFESDIRAALKAQIIALKEAAEVLRPLAWLPGQKSGWLVLPPPGTGELSTAAAARLPQMANPMSWAHAILKSSPGALANTSNAASRIYMSNLVRAQPTDVMCFILHELADVIAATVDAMEEKEPRGRKPYILAPFVLVNLAQAYFLLGRKPAKSASGPFGRFVIDIVQGIGWETEWVSGHIEKAVEDWRQRKQEITFRNA